MLHVADQDQDQGDHQASSIKIKARARARARNRIILNGNGNGNVIWHMARGIGIWHSRARAVYSTLPKWTRRGREAGPVWISTRK
jgi:hypothetical protein